MATTLLREQGADVRDVQLALGHASLASTSVYLPFSDAKRLRNIMGGRRYGRVGGPAAADDRCRYVVREERGERADGPAGDGGQGVGHVAAVEGQDEDPDRAGGGGGSEGGNGEADRRRLGGAQGPSTISERP